MTRKRRNPTAPIPVLAAVGPGKPGDSLVPDQYPAVAVGNPEEGAVTVISPVRTAVLVVPVAVMVPVIPVMTAVVPFPMVPLRAFVMPVFMVLVFVVSASAIARVLPVHPL